MATAKKRGSGERVVEWVGGIENLPTMIEDPAGPYEPAMLVWMAPDGRVLGHETARPEEILERANMSLQQTMKRPLVGKPHVPTRVRVAVPILAEELREGHPGIEFVVGPTPELDELFDGLGGRLQESAGPTESYLADGVGPEQVGAFFRAAAALYRAKPWTVVPSDGHVIGVTIEALGMRDFVLVVIGQRRESLGLILFAGIADYEAFLDAATTGSGEAPRMRFSLTFEGAADIGVGRRREIAKHGWEVAGPAATPWLLSMQDGVGDDHATREELATAEALCLALPELLKDEQAVLSAWDGGAPVTRTIAVTTFAGPIEVSLTVPEEARARTKPGAELLAELKALDGPKKPVSRISRAASARLAREITRRFEASPEGRSLAESGVCGLIMSLAVDFLDMTLASVGPSELHRILFVIMPRSVGVPASDARSVIAALKAFYQFLGRELGLSQAVACGAILGGEAAAKFEAALGDKSLFSPNKALAMAGLDAGVDMNDPVALQAWLELMKGQKVPLPGVPPRAKSAQRKAARKAVKKKR